MIAQILAGYVMAYDFNFVVLNYFNAANVYQTAEIGESHEIETHLIPIIFQHMTCQRENVSMYSEPIMKRQA